MIGIIVNVLAVALGGGLGALLGGRLKASFTNKLTVIFGYCALAMGINSIVNMKNMPAVIISVVFGVIIGHALGIDRALTRMGVLMQKPLRRFSLVKESCDDEDDNLALFTTAVVLFCVSGTGIYGSIDAGMTGSGTILLSKSVLDFFTAMVFACTLGAVTSLISLPQAAVYFLLFALAKLIFPLTTPDMIADFKACGGVLLLATGFRMAKVKAFPIADAIPAMVLVMPLSALWTNYIAPLF